MTRPTHDSPSGHAYLELQRLARQQRRGTQSLLVWYVHERVLYRASISSYRDRLILKGAMLLAALGPRRATQDVDLLARGIDTDHTTVAAVVAEVARIAVDDGVVYEVERLTTQTIRDDDAYSGDRIAVPAHVDRANIVLRLDINVGDPVTPAPVEIDYPSLLGAPFPLRAYPVATVLAEKIVTMTQRGETNTRERDVADIIMLTRRHGVDGDELVAAMSAPARVGSVLSTGRTGNGNAVCVPRGARRSLRAHRPASAAYAVGSYNDTTGSQRAGQVLAPLPHLTRRAASLGEREHRDSSRRLPSHASQWSARSTNDRRATFLNAFSDPVDVPATTQRRNLAADDRVALRGPTIDHPRENEPVLAAVRQRGEIDIGF